MQIIPAVLEKTPHNLFSQIKRFLPYFNTFQIDIADGILVSNRTVQIEEIFRYLTENRLPNTDKLSFDFHLMVKDYEEEIKKLKKLENLIKIQNVFIHFAVFPDYRKLITDYPLFSYGLVLNPEDSVENLTKRYTLNPIPSIQIMTINPGYQGSSFLPETLKKIEQLRNLGYRSEILIDGSVNKKTLPFILSQKYKPNVLVIGSYLIRAKNIKQRIEYLKKITAQTK